MRCWVSFPTPSLRGISLVIQSFSGSSSHSLNARLTSRSSERTQQGSYHGAERYSQPLLQSVMTRESEELQRASRVKMWPRCQHTARMVPGPGASRARGWRGRCGRRGRRGPRRTPRGRPCRGPGTCWRCTTPCPPRNGVTPTPRWAAARRPRSPGSLRHRGRGLGPAAVGRPAPCPGRRPHPGAGETGWGAAPPAPPARPARPARHRRRSRPRPRRQSRRRS